MSEAEREMNEAAYSRTALFISRSFLLQPRKSSPILTHPRQFSHNHAQARSVLVHFSHTILQILPHSRTFSCILAQPRSLLAQPRSFSLSLVHFSIISRTSSQILIHFRSSSHSHAQPRSALLNLDHFLFIFHTSL
jgi:hypothetical protein